MAHDILLFLKMKTGAMSAPAFGNSNKEHNTLIRMKKLKELRLLPLGFAVCLGLLAGCAKQQNGPSGSEDDGQGGDKFDYATTADVRLDVDYSAKGNKARFEVYAENPLAETDGVFHKKQGVNALLKAYTDKDSKYSGVVNLPTAAQKVYLYSEAYGLPTCVEAEVTASGISFELDSFIKKLESASQQQKRPASVQDPVTRDGSNVFNIQTPLGSYDKNGKPDYLEKTMANVPEGLMNRVQNVLMPGTDNSQYAKPAELVNIRMTKDASLNLVFLSEMGQWANPIGYYYYDTNNPPTKLEEFLNLPKYVVLPNCSMYNSSEDYVGGYYPPMKPGMQVKLKYYGKDGQASDIFPAGITVGWFIMPNGFDIYNGKLRMPTNFGTFKCSNSIFNNLYGPEKRFCVSLYDKASGKTVLGFEDGGDNDYKDVLFYLESDPGGAIVDPDRPVINPGEEQYPDVVGDPIEGTLAFEDLWPSQGDYDMNDVVVKYSTTFTTDKDNKIVAIRDVFTPVHAGGKLKSAFGYQLDMPVTAFQSVKIENGSSSAQTINGMELNQDKPVFMLFDDIGQAVAKGAITVTLELKGGQSLSDATRKALYNPFICVTDKGFVPGAVRKEIHLTNYAPTSLADPYPFGRNDDKSSVDKAGNPVGPYYYVTSDSHPFAIDLPTTDYRIPDEMVKIDKFYPDFAGWVNSKGEKNKDWYLKPAKK